MSKTPSHLTRYIKNWNGEKAERVTRSVVITQEHQDFLNRYDLNLSEIVRVHLDQLIKGKLK